MKYILKYGLILLSSVLLFFSCKKEDPAETVDLGLDYFPVNVGHWADYRVDSVSWNDFTATVDTYQYQIREYIESEFTDHEGRLCQRLVRFKRPDDTSQWVVKDVWQLNRTASTAEKVEENVRILKLIFPPSENDRWNGNLFNTLDAREYKYTDVHSPFDVSGMHFDSAVTVLQKEYYTLISEDYQYEVYAKHVGLVYKKFRSIGKKPTGEIEKGTDYTYTLISYGN